MKLFSRIFLFVLLLAVVAAAGCGGRHDRRLVKVYELSDTSPSEAVTLLDSIDRRELSESDGHYYDLLYIKSHDKMYVRHISDSLIQEVIDYYSSQKKSPEYIESLYYGGRVYSDLGDFPKALEYFYETLELTDQEKQENGRISRVLSQISEVLVKLRLYENAKTIIKKSIDHNKKFHRLADIVDNLTLLSWIYYKTGNSDSAVLTLESILFFDDPVCDASKTEALVSLAMIESNRGNVGKALNIIRPLPQQCDSLLINYALANAADIYMKAGIYDTAYMYSKRLVENSIPNNKKAGYHVMLSPGVIKFINPDSLYYHFNNYKNILELYYDQHDSQAAIMQQTRYNYEGHVREKENVLRIVDYLKTFLYTCVIILLLLSSVIFYLRNRNKSQYIQLMETLARLSEYEKRHNQENSKNGSDNVPEVAGCVTSEENSCETEDRLKDPEMNLAQRERNRYKLRDKLLSMQCTRKEAWCICDKLRESEVFKQLEDLVCRDRPLKEDSPLWKNLENTISVHFPGFKKNIEILSDTRLSKIEYHIIILMKYGVPPVQVAGLLCKTKSNISYYRSRLKEKLFDDNSEKVDIDKLIYLI